MIASLSTFGIRDPNPQEGTGAQDDAHLADEGQNI
jgi:hypothetical protein